MGSATIPLTTELKCTISNLSFDSLYFYGKNSPIHISIGLESNCAITRLEQSPSEQLIL